MQFSVRGFLFLAFMLEGKKILLGITGGIAAYKTASLCRLLVKQGAQVKVIVTPSVEEFIGKLTLATLTNNPVNSEFVSNEETGEWTNHVELALWADLFLVAPLTANTLAKMCTGVCDNLLLATYLSAKCPVMVAPAMDRDMWQHFTTQHNIELLQENKVKVLLPESGFLASGLQGEGRMQEPEAIAEACIQFFNANQPLKGKKILVSAGPTYERIDPVRFIGNFSSGKMGYAIAKKAIELGAEVHLVSGPVHIEKPHGLASFTAVESALEMHEAVQANFPKCDVGILSAAVADYRPSEYADQKIKKEKGGIEQITLTENPDIIAALGKQKKEHQMLVGFALETQNEIENGKSKLERKNLDMIVVNSLNEKGAGFGTDTNKVTLVKREGEPVHFNLKTKDEVALDILKEVEVWLK